MVNNMWIIYALLAAFFAGITAVFAKMSLSDIDSSFASSLRTIVILLFFLILVLFQVFQQHYFGYSILKH